MNAITDSTFQEDALLARHAITAEEFKQTGLEWSVLKEIAAHHVGAAADLRTAGNYISQRLQNVPDVHSLKVRVKNPENLIAKIIRKKLEHHDLDFTVQSYQELVTDLIGLRALHLFKDEWRSIHDFVSSTWNLHENPIAYVRQGDPTELFEESGTAKLDVRVHPFGYRSIHYLVEFHPDKRTYLAELQVRTIFEEGWSEIDHRVRYPRHSDDKYLSEFLGIFNRLSGSADEMGSFIKLLVQKNQLHAHELADRDKKIEQIQSEMKTMVKHSKLSDKEKGDLRKQIEAMRAASTSLVNSTVNLISSPTVLSTGIGLKGPTIFASLLTSERTCSSCGKTFTPTSTGLTSVTIRTCPHCGKFYF